MADNGTGEKNVSAIKHLLSKAVKAIEGLNASTSEHSSSSPSAAANSGPEKSAFKTELERLFPNVYAGNKKRPSTASNSSTTRGKRRVVSSKKKDKTVTRKFVCLADREQVEVPSAQEKRDLFICSLGEKKISLPVNGTCTDMHRILRSEFPKLLNAGGFELMFAEPGKKELKLIPNGPNGMTVDYITQFIGQGRIFIRPIQCSLDQSTSVISNAEEMEEMCNSCLEFIPIKNLREHSENCPAQSVAQETFGENTQVEIPDEVIYIPDHRSSAVQPSGVMTSQEDTSSISPVKHNQPQSSTSHWSNCELNTSRDFLYSSLLFDDEVIVEDAESEQDIPAVSGDDQEDLKILTKNSLEEILSELAHVIDESKISIFNVCRSDIWSGAKRALKRKSFSPSSKMSVRFSDDYGRSEGAIDRGGPTREFLTLVLSWIASSKIFCGTENKFLSCNAECLDNEEYFYAGQIVALSLVHGGPGIKCLSPVVFDALVKGPDRTRVRVDDVYDPELKLSLEQLSRATSVMQAHDIISSNHLDTVLELAGTLQCMKSVEDVHKVVQQTAHWYVLGRSWPALDQFKNGLSVLGVMDAVESNPDVFVKVFCPFPDDLTPETFSNLFSITLSDEGSNKRALENVIVSYWNDYILDVYEGETELSFGEILFFSCGCKEIPPLGCHLVIEFLHEPEENGQQSKFPKANTCGPVLRLPVVHKSYDSFKNAVTFAIANTKGFGYW